MNRSKPVLIVALLVSQLLTAGLALFVQGSTGVTSPAERTASTMYVASSSIEVSPSREHILVGQEVTFYLNATSDVVGATLNFTIYYDYFLADGSVNPSSAVDVVSSANPGAVVTQYTYTSVGNCTTIPIVSADPYYVVRLVIDDGMSSPVTKSLLVWVYENTAPYFTMAPPETVSVDLGEEISLSFDVADYDDDPLYVTWDFGDGSPVASNSSTSSITPVIFAQSHEWNPVLDAGLLGDYHIYYFVNISISDGQGHYLNETVLADIYVPHNFSPDASLSVDSYIVDPADEVAIYAGVTDVEGDPITWTFTIRNDTETVDTLVYHTDSSSPSTTVWNNITYLFGVPGNYSVTLYFSDAIDALLQVDAHNKSVSVSGIRCVNNSIPYVLGRITVSPETPWLNETTWSKEVYFALEVADLDGDTVTLVWDFGDGSPTATNNTLDGSLTLCSQTHVYTDGGMYNVSAVATDGRAGHEVLRWRFVNVSSNNSAPGIVAFVISHANGSFSVPNSSVGFTITFQDDEFDPLNVTIEFGDGSAPIWFYLTEFNETGCAVVQFNHTYMTVGDFSLWINFTDYKFSTSAHDERWVALVRIDTVDPVEVRFWNIWDYVGLAMLFLMVAGLVAWGWMGVRKRKALDKMGMTWDEYKLHREVSESFEFKSEGDGKNKEDGIP